MRGSLAAPKATSVLSRQHETVLTTRGGASLVAEAREEGLRSLECAWERAQASALGKDRVRRLATKGGQYPPWAAPLSAVPTARWERPRPLPTTRG